MYRTIDTATWTDPKIRSLSFKHKFVFLYLITSHYSHVSGIYYLPIKAAAEEMGLPEKELMMALDALSVNGMVAFDAHHGLVWVKKMLYYQGSGPKVYASVGRHLHSLHGSPLVLDYLNAYPQVETFFSTFAKAEKPKTDRVSRNPDRVSENPDRVSSVGNDANPTLDTLSSIKNDAPDRVSDFGLQEQEQQQHQEQHQEPPLPPAGGFARFWLAYPRKVGKGAAEKAWGRIRPDQALQERILAAIEKQKQSAAWRKNNGQFIPHPTTWLNQRRWEDEPETVGGGGLDFSALETFVKGESFDPR